MPVESRKLNNTLMVIIKANIPDSIFSIKGMIMFMVRKSWISDALILFQYHESAPEANQTLLYLLDLRTEMSSNILLTQKSESDFSNFKCIIGILHTKNTASKQSWKGVWSQVHIKENCIQGEVYWLL